MLDLPAHRMTVDEFLTWDEGRPGRRELIAGRPFDLRQQTVGLARMKSRISAALMAAVERLPGLCEAFPDGTTVAVDPFTAFQPYALVRCGQPLSRDTILVPDPVIIVEIVLFGVARGYDTMGKLAGYFAMPSLQHYLIVDGDDRSVTHCRRRAHDIETLFHDSGSLRLSPPGLDLTVEDLIGPIDAESP